MQFPLLERREMNSKPAILNQFVSGVATEVRFEDVNSILVDRRGFMIFVM
jgi:hypothetical protein